MYVHMYIWQKIYKLPSFGYRGELFIGAPDQKSSTPKKPSIQELNRSCRSDGWCVVDHTLSIQISEYLELVEMDSVDGGRNRVCAADD